MRENLLAFLCCSPNQALLLERAVAAADVELLLLIIARVFFSDDNNGAVERKENHLRKSIFGFVADVDMEPCLQWLPSGCPVEMFLSSAELSQ